MDREPIYGMGKCPDCHRVMAMADLAEHRRLNRCHHPGPLASQPQPSAPEAGVDR